MKKSGRVNRNRVTLNQQIIKRRKMRLKASPVLVERHIKSVQDGKTVARFLPPTDGYLEGSIYTAGLQGAKELSMKINYGKDTPLMLILTEGVYKLSKLPVIKGKVIQVIPVIPKDIDIKIDEIYVSLYFMGIIK